MVCAVDTSSNAVLFLSRGSAAKRTEAAALFTGADELAKALSFALCQLKTEQSLGKQLE